MAVITPAQIIVTGLLPTFISAVGPDTFVNNGENTILIIDNQNASSCVVTVDGTGTAPTGAVAFDDDVAVTVLTTDRQQIGPFPKGRFGSTVTVNYSLTASVTVAVTTL